MLTRHISVMASQTTDEGVAMLGLESSLEGDAEVEEFMSQLEDSLEDGMEILGFEVYTIH